MTKVANEQGATEQVRPLSKHMAVSLSHIPCVPFLIKSLERMAEKITWKMKELSPKASVVLCPYSFN